MKVRFSIFLASVGLAVFLLLTTSLFETTPTAGRPNADGPVQALGWWMRPDDKINRMPTLFVDIRSRKMEVGGRQFELLCDNDGPGNLLIKIDGEFYIFSGTGVNPANKGALWVVVNGARKFVRNSEGIDGLQFVRESLSVIRAATDQLCPSAASQGPINGIVQRINDAISRGQKTYVREAARLGLEEQPQSYKLPQLGSVDYDQKIVRPAQKACEALSRLVRADERALFMSQCFREQVASCEELYRDRGYC